MKNSFTHLFLVFNFTNYPCETKIRGFNYYRDIPDLILDQQFFFMSAMGQKQTFWVLAKRVRFGGHSRHEPEGANESALSQKRTSTLLHSC
jgi:hypothetical protein